MIAYDVSLDAIRSCSQCAPYSDIIDNMDAYQTLVIILSIALAVFLLLGIISAILMITFFKKINRIANSIEKVMNNIETLSDATTKVATPLIALKALLDKLSFRK